MARKRATKTTSTAERALFEQHHAAFVERGFPLDGFVLGEPVDVLGVEFDGNVRRGLTATCLLGDLDAGRSWQEGHDLESLV